MNTQATILIQSLGWALLHSLWQVLLIYCCLKIVIRISGHVTARLKYHLSAAAMAGSLVWFINTCIAQYQRLQGITIQVTQSGTDPALTKTYAVTTLPSNSYSGKLLNTIIAGIEPYFPLLVGIYAAGVLLLLARLTVNLLQIKGLRNKGVSDADAYWTEWIEQWQHRLDISRKVTLFFSDRVNIPMTMGALKPVILLPVASMNSLSQDQLEAILLHELAHIKRHDYLLNILQAIVETTLFFNPFLWLISRIIRREREHCCDDVVLAHFNTPLPYAKALAALETGRHTNGIALAATGNKHQLLNRIKRIMEMKKKTVNHTQFGIAAILILALILSVAWFSPIMAQTKKTVAKDKKGNTSVTKTVTAKNGKNVIAQTIIVKKDISEDNGVHPKDRGNAEDLRKNMEQSLEGITFGEMDDEIKSALAGIDWDEVAASAGTAITKVDLSKIGEETSIAMARIDWDEINREIKKAGKNMPDVDWDEINKEMKAATATATTSGTKVYTINMQNGNLTSTANNISVNNHDFNTMLKKMEDDGVIDRSTAYKIEFKNGTLYIDGRKQTGSKAAKYTRYMEDDAHTVITGSKNSTSINVDINR